MQRQAGGQTDAKTGRHINRQLYRQADIIYRQAGRQARRQIHRQKEI